jgi:hypothetical protein
VGDFPFELANGLAQRLARALDAEGKIPRALLVLGELAGRDVVLLDARDGLRERQLTELGARVTQAETNVRLATLPEASADAVISWWSGFRGLDPAEVAAAERVLRPGGRLLIVHDYGRDDVSRLRGDLPDYGLWSRRDGPFLRGGFRIRVLHCWWTFDSLDDAREFLSAAFGSVGVEVAAGMRRPRLSYNVAIYHRARAAATS